MAATIMDGKALAAKVKEEVRQQTAQMGRKPVWPWCWWATIPPPGSMSMEKNGTAVSAAFTARNMPSRQRPASRNCWSWWRP